MSLINDALKKAQRQRTEVPAATAEGTSAGGARIAKRGRALSANTMVLIGSGAVVLIVLSVVITFNLVNEPAKPAKPPTAITPPSAPVTSVETPAPPPPAPHPAAAEVKAPTFASAEVKAPSAPSVSVPIASLNPPAPAPAPSPVPTAPTVPNPPPPAAVVIAPADLPADERALAFIETIRVTGIRSFGKESRVLMNERVYRVNDIVERNVGLKLTAVKSDCLVFTDPRGKTYTKNF